MAKRVVGLTGGIASGKSTVARMFSELGAAVIDADQLARKVVEVGTPGLAQLVDAFGEDILHDDGALDRKALGDLVFSDEAARKTLNAITHPLIAQAGAVEIMKLQSSDTPYIVYEAALLIENRSHTMFSALILVTCSEDTQLERVQERDGLAREEAQARIDSQMPLEDKIPFADFVIENNHNLSQTSQRVQEVHQALINAEPPASTAT